MANKLNVVEKKEINSFTLEYKVNIDYSDFLKQRDKTIKEISKHLKVSGFRKGFIPVNIVEREVKKEFIEEETVKDILSKLYPEFLKEENIKPIDYPKINIGSVINDAPIEISLELVLKPQIKVSKYKGIKAKKQETKASEADIANVVDNLKNRFATLNNITDKKIEKENMVNINVSAKSENQIVKELTGQNMTIPLNSENILPGFNEAIIGKNINDEVNVTLEFPDNYPIKKIAAKKVDFQIKINAIQEKILPEINNEFVKNYFNKETKEEFLKDIEDNLNSQKEKEAKEKIINEVLENIAQENSFEVPQVLVNNEMEILISDVEESLKRYNSTLKDYIKMKNVTEEDFKKDYEKIALNRIKSRLILDEIGQKENLKPNSEEIQNEIEKIAKDTNKPIEEIKNTLGEEPEYIVEYLSRQKALDFIYDNAVLV